MMMMEDTHVDTVFEDAEVEVEEEGVDEWRMDC